MTIIIFLIVLFVIVLVHEWGHFIVAKKTGMRVDEFGIGFPPKLYGKKKGETEYTLNLLPLGGFVRIYGENLEEIPDSEPDKKRAFGKRPRLAQAAVLVAGVTMNVILAWVLFIVVFSMGTLSQVSEENATDTASLYIVNIMPESPLAENINSAVEVLGVKNSEGTEVEKLTPSVVTDFIKNGAEGEELEISFKRPETEAVETLKVVPKTGLIADDESRLALGVALSLVERVSYPFPEAVKMAGQTTAGYLRDIVVGLFDLIARAFNGSADFSQVAGPVGIAGMVGEAASVGFAALLTFTAIISLNLAVINLLPIPALDGGRLLFVLIEAIIRKPIPPAVAGVVNLVGIVILLGIFVMATYSDIIRILNQ